MEAHLHGAKKLGTSKRLWEVLENGHCWTGKDVSKEKEAPCV